MKSCPNSTTCVETMFHIEKKSRSCSCIPHKSRTAVGSSKPGHRVMSTILLLAVKAERHVTAACLCAHVSCQEMIHRCPCFPGILQSPTLNWWQPYEKNGIAIELKKGRYVALEHMLQEPILKHSRFLS